MMPREEPIEQSGAGAADMKKAGGRGGEADDDGHSPRMGSDRTNINDRATCGRETSRAGGSSSACRSRCVATPHRPAASSAGNRAGERYETGRSYIVSPAARP